MVSSLTAIVAFWTGDMGEGLGEQAGPSLDHAMDSAELEAQHLPRHAARWPWACPDSGQSIRQPLGGIGWATRSGSGPPASGDSAVPRRRHGRCAR